MKECRGQIILNKQIAKGIFELVIKSTDLLEQQVMPGMFAHLEIPNSPDLTLRRPISINSYKKDTLTLVYQVVGEGTKRLSNINGGVINFTASLGKGFILPEKPSKILLVGAGIGLAPLRFIAEFAPQHIYYTFAGFRNAELVYQLDIFKGLSKELLVCTDDGSMGEKSYLGVLTEKNIDVISPDLILACGPEIVLKQLKDIAKSAEIPCQISMEARMGCGTGACMVCNCKIGHENDWHYKRCCADGPVFNAKEVLFNG